MNKLKLLYVFFLLAFMQVSGQSVTFNESAGWIETAFVKWQPVENAGRYNVYYSGEGVVNKQVDDYLIRSYGSYLRADVLGLKAGNYTITVKPVILGIEGSGSTTGTLTVLSQDRNGFAFHGGRVPGGYKADGTPKDNAVILYITEKSKNTISFNVITNNNGNTTNYVGFQNIFSGIKKGIDKRPYIFRLVGNITDFTDMEGGDLVVENKNNDLSYITVEGVGDDATANGWGIRVKNATNIEIANLGFMNCDSSEGDNIGMQQNNSYIWVHNNDLFYGHAGSDADQIKGDGALDNKGTSYATYSYNHFWDSGKASLLGLSENTTAGLYVTYHHNWFDHSDSRHPRVRYYSAHIYNNYFDGIAKYGSGSTEGSSLFLEGNYFRNAKNPMMISLQGTDVWNPSKQMNDPTNQGTFSGEDGGMIKAFNNLMDADIATNSMRFVAYADPNPLYNIEGKISSLTDFDAYLAATRGETVPATVKSKVGAKTYNNFDTDASLYVKNLSIEEPTVARDKTKLYAGRVQGGDFKWTFDNAVDDKSYAVITGLKSALTNYGTSMVYIQAEGSSQTLVNTSGNKDQTVATGAAVAPIVFTWGGDATDVTLTGVTNGLTFTKDTMAKTVTITGTPTQNTSYTVTTVGTSGTSASISGTVTVGTPGNPGSTDGMIHNFTTSGKISTFYAITGNMNSTDGSQSYDGLTLTKRFKMESSTSIKYTTTAESTLTLVFDADFAKVVKFDGVNYTANNGIVTIPNVAAGEHTITKGDTTNLYYIKTVYSTMATSDINKAQVTLYPNPVSDHLYINTAGQKVLSVKVYNFAGALVKNIFDAKADSVDLRNLVSGNYIISITTDKGTITKKIIKK
ncbi:T9SS type A sorting domain-containing protein [Epilithonimonas zeae]|uniref:Por secretion system C-terminal sorting domain-containing protein n=1 Tax=Epilithonimonas zeae TaxID=1416779 RepID=A0A1N6EJ29_9FLAO|nr:T9SS type A sorting domain-containing protein [Epilithonimonas zeae]SIN83045.1 Por secretion system C-terminal sorting domain-containing protein [Epilithonimonas zeae]